MKKTNNRKIINNKKKYSIRKGDLEGLKKVPTTKNERQKLISKCNQLLNNYEELLETRKKEAIGKLGYDFDKDFCVDSNLKLKEVQLRNSKNPQTFAIPLDPTLAKRFLLAPKYVIKTFDSEISGEHSKHVKHQKLCLAMMPEGPVLFEFYVHYKYGYNKVDKTNYNIGIYAMLQGRDYLHLERYDSIGNFGHTQIFDKKGNVVYKTMPKSEFENKAHTHEYDIKYSLLFTSKKAVGHEDRKLDRKYQCIEQAQEAWEKRLKIKDLKLDFGENETIFEIMEKIVKLENTNKQIKTANFQNKNGEKKNGNNKNGRDVE